MPAPDPEHLLALLQSFIGAPTWAASRRVVERAPELLTDEADALLAHLLEQYHDDAQAVRALAEHRNLLRRCRDEGIEAAFAGREDASPEEALHALLEQARSDPEARAMLEEMQRQAMEHPLMRAVQALIDARSPAEVLRAAREHPALLTDEADALIRQGIENARQAGEDGMARHVEERYETLRQVRELGASPEELAGLTEAGERVAAALSALPEELRRMLAELIERESISSPEQPRGALEAHPQLWEALGQATQTAGTGAGVEVPAEFRGAVQEAVHLQGQVQRHPHLAGRVVEAWQRILDQIPLDKDPAFRAAVLGSLGTAYSELPTGDRGENLARAIQCYQQALTVYTPQTWPDRCLMTATNMGRLAADRAAWQAAFGDGAHAAHRRWQVAAEGFSTAVAALDPLLEEADAAGRRRIVEENAASYWRAVEATFNLRRSDRSLALVEAGKSRRFLAELAETAFAPPPGMPARWLERETRLRRQRAALRAAVARASGAERTRLWRDLDAARADLDTLYGQMEEAGFADYVDLRQGHSPDFDDIRRFVDRQGPATLLLALYTLPQSTLVFALAAADETPFAEEVPLGQERLGGFLLAAQEELFSPPRDHAAPIGPFWRQLSRQLLPPGLDPLLERTRRLVIVPERQFHYLPLHALLWRGEPLGVRYPVVYAPSVGVAARAQARQRGGTHPIVAFGYAQKAEHKPYIERVATEIGALFERKATTGEDATPDAVLEAARQARVLHVHCHGHFEPGEPMQSGLELAGGRLTAERVIAEGRLPGSLVNLSACATGRVGLETGDEFSGLMRAFFRAGAATLVLSLWPVSAAATMALMGGFYNRLRAGADRDVALRDAMLALRRELPHPYYWAPFIVAGDWRA